MGFLYIPIFCDIWEIFVALMLLWYLPCSFMLSARQRTDDGRIHIQMHHELLLFWVLLRSWALLLKIKWKLQSILGGNPMFFSSSVYIQILLFFLKAHIAYQSSAGTDHVWGRLVRLSCAKGNCALGVYSEWHSPEGFDHKLFFPDYLF